MNSGDAEASSAYQTDLLKVVFAASALKDYRDFEQKDPKVFKRINRLLKNIKETPFALKDTPSDNGLGKPEPLKHNWTGYWSRRITQEHRLVYKVTEDKILVAQCKFHY